MTLVEELPLPVDLTDQKFLVPGHANFQPDGATGIRHEIRAQFGYKTFVGVNDNSTIFIIWVGESKGEVEIVVRNLYL